MREREPGWGTHSNFPGQGAVWERRQARIAPHLAGRGTYTKLQGAALKKEDVGGAETSWSMTVLSRQE